MSTLYAGYDQRRRRRRKQSGALALVFQHTFTGVNIATPPSPSDSGHTMSNIDVGTAATWSRTTNRLTLAVAPGNYSGFVANTGKANARSRAKVRTLSTGIMFRAADAANFNFVEMFNPLAGPARMSLALTKRVAGVNTQLASAVDQLYDPAAGDQLIIDHFGSSVKVFLTQGGATPVFNLTEAANASNVIFGALSGGNIGLEIDDLIQEA